MKSLEVLHFRNFALAVFMLFLVTAQAQDAPQPSRQPVLIRDTDLADEKEPEPVQILEPDPVQSKQNLNVGNTYYKRRNYAAAISRYIDAIAWQPDSIPAHEALARAYEKTGNLAQAIQTLKTVTERNPDYPKNREFRSKIVELEKKLE